MPLSLRFVVPLALALAAIAYAVVPLVDRLTFQWFVRDLDARGALIAQTAQEPLAELMGSPRGSRTRVLRYFERIMHGERIYALGFCDLREQLLYATSAFPKAVGCSASGEPEGRNWVLQLADGPLHVSANPVSYEGTLLGQLMIVHDMSFVQRRSEDTKKYVLWLFAAIAAVVALITVVIAEISWRGWVAGLTALLSGETLLRSPLGFKGTAPELRPIARDLQSLLRDIESERRTRDESQTTWGPDALRRILRQDLKGDEVLIVSNREPYIHVRRKDNVIDIQRPASGLVTALEPIVRACSGTWIAHGAGNADRDTVDKHDHVMVPPEHPSYRIRRVWLSPEEEQGYYFGFANEGLWPLCHIAHTRPVFRAPDWEHYQTVNRRFADVVADEARTEDPIILVQDYHFALLPRMVRERLPRATIITFWHIPWPNPEAFGILPWREEVLDGLLGSSILGFHTQFHCNNFFDTVDRFLEARVDRETFTISYGGNPTEVRRYPISIEWPPAALQVQAPVPECRTRVRQRLGLAADVKLGVGVDRLDYTKGILERFSAIERLLELEPRWIGQFSFVQVAAPSRSSIEEYQNLEARVRALAARINERFGRPGYTPIVLRIEHHDAAEVYELYRAAELCVVSSLHDGMNLVAKEFVAARDDEHGVLILSQFTGAARELAEALTINPYDIEQSAAALHLALGMSPDEQRARMRSMRHLVQEFNVYRWAGRMLIDAARMRHRRRVMARTRAARREAGAA
ncbi:MAG: trehalose-6-phosphate synthase [Betaproteobacteria bacterium RIFCSPLOWO2_12_FULL_68_19]|nr:MAG: trehalose-6-phosphate synthase [Betaproteobacteria bacterium RIFCSPLOWO2_12_FULL_68_19]